MEFTMSIQILLKNGIYNEFMILLLPLKKQLFLHLFYSNLQLFYIYFTIILQ